MCGLIKWISVVVPMLHFLLLFNFNFKVNPDRGYLKFLNLVNRHFSEM